MKKNKTSSKQKFNNEKIFNHPLKWCPLFGYMPEVFDTHLQKIPIYIPDKPIMVDHNLDTDMLSTFDVAFDCRDYIKEAREYWGINQAHFDLIKYDPKPDIEKLPIKTDEEGKKYIYNRFDQKCNVARFLFYNLNKIAWGEYFPCVKIKSFSSTRLNWPKCDILERSSEGLLCDAQDFINKNINTIGSTYRLCLDELYSLCAIYESLHLMITLLNEKYTQKDQDVVFSYIDYIEKLLDAAENQKKIRLLEFDKNEITEKARPYRDRQSKNAKIKAAKEKLKIDIKHDGLKSIAEKLLKEFFKNKRFSKINASEITRIMIKEKTNDKLKDRQLRKIITPSVKKYKAMTKV